MNDRRHVVYIAGPISGNDDYKQDFECVQNALEYLGYIVLSPAVLPYGMDESKYMPICLSMIDAAEIVFMMQEHENSKGAQLERSYARYQGKLTCVTYTELVTCIPPFE